MPTYVQDYWIGVVFMVALTFVGLVSLVSGSPHPFTPPYRPNAQFHGYACYDDCRDHRSAYAWAEREGVTDPAECRHLSRAFSEGCKAWVRDRTPSAS